MRWRPAAAAAPPAGAAQRLGTPRCPGSAIAAGLHEGAQLVLAFDMFTGFMLSSLCNCLHDELQEELNREQPATGLVARLTV